MKITILLGNGFDVSLGIKSSYGDFYEWYYNKKPSKLEHINNFRAAIKTDMQKDVPDDKKTWADFELGLGQYASNFTKETVEEFLDCHEDAQDNIRIYLKEQEASFRPENFTIDSFKTFPQSICNFYEEATDLEKISIDTMLNKYLDQDREISFITFNYTETLEQLFSKMEIGNLPRWNYHSAAYGYKINPNIIRVHGTLDVFPVLGVNDESQIANKELLETPQFKELLLKAENVRALGQLWHSKAEEQISNSKVVCIFGMSLGPTDAKWWRKLVQWLKTDGSRQIILYWFEKDHPGHILSRKQLRCVNAVKDRFLSYSALSTDETIALKNRIHVIINTSKFMALKRSTEEEIMDEGSDAKESLFKRLDEIEAKVDSQPKIFVGEEEPKDSKEGDIWFQPV